MKPVDRPPECRPAWRALYQQAPDCSDRETVFRLELPEVGKAARAVLAEMTFQPEESEESRQPHQRA